jgi:hypothetical protein
MLRALAVSCACLLAVPATALAEWHITPMVGLTFAGKTTITDLDEGTGKRHPNLAVSVALFGEGILGVEGIATTTPGFFQSGEESGLFPPGEQNSFVDSSRLTSLMGNVVVTVPRRWTEYFLRPFVSGGFGLIRVSKLETGEVFSATTNLFGYNVGGGAIGFLTRGTGVRFDLRYYSTVHGTDPAGGGGRPPIAFGDVHLRFMTASIGLVIRR